MIPGQRAKGRLIQQLSKNRPGQNPGCKPSEARFAGTRSRGFHAAVGKEAPMTPMQSTTFLFTFSRRTCMNLMCDQPQRDTHLTANAYATLRHSEGRRWYSLSPVSICTSQAAAGDERRLPPLLIWVEYPPDDTRLKEGKNPSLFQVGQTNFKSGRMRGEAREEESPRPRRTQLSPSPISES